jgi:predicted transcriptional regulator
MAKRFMTTIRITEDARSLLERLSDKHGVSHTAIIEIAIREKAKRDRAESPRCTLATPTTSP